MPTDKISDAQIKAAAEWAVFKAGKEKPSGFVKPGDFEKESSKESHTWDPLMKTWREVQDSTFTKYDDGKLQWSKFCWRAAAKVLQVMHYGADKYGWDNWRKATTIEDRRRYLDATMRHLTDYMNGENMDPDSGNPHLWHAACSLLFFLEYDAVGSRRDGIPGTIVRHNSEFPCGDIGCKICT